MQNLNHQQNGQVSKEGKTNLFRIENDRRAAYFLQRSA